MLILIVDDIDKNREMLAQYLGLQNYAVKFAESGAEALALVDQYKFDLVLLDINMPGMSGYEAANEIKRKQKDHYLPIIFVTAYSEEECFEKAIASGGDDFISKPVNFDVLMSKIISHQRIRELYDQVVLQSKELTKHNLRLVREHELVSHFFEQAAENCFVDDKVVRTLTKPMSEFNGDTTLIARRPNGGVTVLLGDFTGHGLAAAVGTLPIAQIFYKMVEKNKFIGDIARELNRQIGILLPVEMFFAASLVELSTNGDRLMVWHGGLPNAVLWDRSSSNVQIIRSQHVPLGIREDDEFSDAVQLFYVNKDCKLFLFTDGITECEDEHGQMMGEVPILQIIQQDHSNHLNAIYEKYERYCNGAEQKDDISIIELDCVGVPAESSVQADAKDAESIPWTVKVRVEDQQLEQDVAQKMIDLIGHGDALKDHKGIVHTLISEMYTNALDHGVLDLHGLEKSDDDAFEKFYREREKRLQELQGAYIETELVYNTKNNESAELVIVMHHNGHEFDVENTEINDSGLHGRGMELINAICDSVIYSDKGRRLTVIYKVNNDN